jgi:catechol 2,3-dioxygenase-like lactoylglutathione lyase family enzyme
MKEKSESNIDQYSYDLGVVGGFSEMINSGVKRLALSAPLSPEEMDTFIIDAERIAAEHKVSVYRESDLLETGLFPSSVVSNKDVLLLFQGTTLDEYLSMKAEKAELEKNGAYDIEASLKISRRFGRLLSYSPRKINFLLSQNTAFRTMDDFGIRAASLFLYFKDLERASHFYSTTLGMELVADYKMAKILRMVSDSYLVLVDASKGMHTADEPKTVALALLTDRMEQWYAYLKNQKVNMKYEYQPKAGSPHDSFVITDPEGYLLEFEEFNQHPENERFIPILEQNKKRTIPSSLSTTVPDGLSIHSTITWLYYKDILAMQNFYQDVLGLEMLVDQGTNKIYRVSDTAFMGIVDEKRGMHRFTDKKAVNVGFILDELESWYGYVKGHKPFDLLDDELGIGSETRYKAFVGICPENYYLEFDQFYPHDDNKLLLKYLGP